MTSAVLILDKTLLTRVLACLLFVTAAGAQEADARGPGAAASLVRAGHPAPPPLVDSAGQRPGTVPGTVPGTGPGQPAHQVIAFGELDDALRRLLAGSERFRQSYAQVVGAGVAVRITRHRLIPHPKVRAVTRIGRTRERVVIAFVEVMPQYDPIELIAHEFEHIAEQVEGVDYHQLLRARKGGARRTTGHAFETKRAAEAGRIAARQVRETERARKAEGRLARAR